MFSLYLICSYLLFSLTEIYQVFYLLVTELSLFKVIGLHKNGYGRILSECTFTAKMLYCLWVTLPEEDDNFIIETTKPLPEWKDMSEKEQKQFIRERIIGQSNEDLVKVKTRWN